MSERVSIIQGRRPAIIVAPHGYDRDDENTTIVAEAIAKSLGCYAVINRGWERADEVDIFNDKADCNNTDHCHEDVLFEEFLQPIVRFRNRIRKMHPIAYVFMIHGMSDKHRILSSDPKLDIVVGYGAGSPDSFSCDIWRKNALIHYLEETGLVTYEGKKGGAMSGWARQNMNQLFRKWYPDPTVQSFQIEIIHDLRTDKDICQLTGEFIANAIGEMMDRIKFNGSGTTKKY